jgi:hypothetical protein
MEKRRLDRKILFSKHNYITFRQCSCFNTLWINLLFDTKQKYKYSVFYYLVINILFFGKFLKIRSLYQFKNLIQYQIQIIGYKVIIFFLMNFITVYYPSIDSTKNEIYTGNRVAYSKGIFCSIFFRLPLVQETNLLLYMFDHFIVFFNNCKYRFIIFYNKRIKSIDYLDQLHLIKYPVKSDVKIF